MASGDHRSLKRPRAVAAVSALLPVGYLAPALAGAIGSLRPMLGIADRTLDGVGYGLTFDDGPHIEGTPAVLGILAEHDVKATFFLVGEQVARAPALACEVVAAGHGIGLHCYRHRNLMRLGPRAVADDIARAQALIEETTGVSIASYRPPYGIFNGAALQIARRNGWRSVLWTHWGRDWDRRASAQSITRRIVGGEVAPGSVLLLHDADHYAAVGSWRNTVAALPGVLDELAARGLESSLAV